jgi:hypothetical protein
MAAPGSRTSSYLRYHWQGAVSGGLSDGSWERVLGRKKPSDPAIKLSVEEEYLPSTEEAPKVRSIEFRGGMRARI